MRITGENFIGFQGSSENATTFSAVDPASATMLEPVFYEATSTEVGRAAEKADEAFTRYRTVSGREKSVFLEEIADEILRLGDILIQRCMVETGLPEGRITGERTRTVNQLRLFAQLVRDGSWVDARIDTSGTDIRSMKKALGPVGIFGAANFPLAFSVAGGDTASALAAGCSVVIKAHPGHPGTCELVARALLNAVRTTGMPDGTVNMVHGRSHAVGMAIVEHPLITAVGFTGSFRGGKALFDVASRRSTPIPVYAEMGSVNPVFLLPGAMATNGEEIAKGLAASVTLGVGQFCTNPGLVILQNTGDTQSFLTATMAEFTQSPGGTMLGEAICKTFYDRIEAQKGEATIRVLAEGKGAGDDTAHGTFHGRAVMLGTSARQYLSHPEFEEEVFGPSTLTVTADTKKELTAIAKQMGGHLTATVWGTDGDLVEYAELISELERKVGRLIINGFPTGVEVCHAMVHGGPFPATTDARSTSVGTRAIDRFTRPVCYQNFPDHLLPEELQSDNPLGIRRLVNGVMQPGPGPDVR